MLRTSSGEVGTNVTVKFSRNLLTVGQHILQPSQEVVKTTPALWNCGVEDAMRYGGELTRAALSAMRLRGDRRYIVVDTKVHMLKRGFMPAIPGWHTDGAPRGGVNVSRWHDTMLNPTGPYPPNIQLQEGPTPPRFHLLVTGLGCMTEFINTPVDIDVPSTPSRDLYAHITRQVQAKVDSGDLVPWVTPTCTVTEWDWWMVHRGVPATMDEWRFLIRVTETDWQMPQTDLRAIYRTQQQVYLPMEYGW